MTTRRKFVKNILFGSTLVGLSPLRAFASDKEVVKLSILHTNDMHSNIEPFTSGRNKGLGGMHQLSSLIKKVRSEEENVLLLDAGDVFQGTPYFNKYKGSLELKIMSQMGYLASTMGNHDFDNGVDGLARQAKNAEFKLLSANYNFDHTPMKGLTQPYHIFTKGKFTVGVFGLGVELKGLVDPKMYGNTVYEPAVKTAKKISNYLRHEKECNLIICLSHLGLKYETNQVSDMVLAEHCSEIDIILGGHTHDFIESPIEIQSKNGQNTYISQVGWAGIKLGRIDVYLNSATNKPLVKSEIQDI